MQSRSFIVALALLVGTRITEAQTTFGSITGTVIDQSNAPIPGAKVTVTNQGTQLRQQVSTSSTGVFNVPNLSVGVYEVRVEAAGFGAFEKGDLVLNANQVLNVDASLSVAATASSTEVTATIGAIDTETNALMSLRTASDLKNMPVVSRQDGGSGYHATLAWNTGFSPSPNGTIYVNGTRTRPGASPTMDGIRVMQFPLGAGPEAPGLDSIEEVNLQFGNTQAEFMTQAQWTVVTKAGSNEFHGSLYWNYNGNWLNARDFFATSVPFRVYNDYSATIGGPIRKNKTFYFGNYERSTESALTLLNLDVPLPAWRMGNFAGAKTITDPTIGQPFPLNVIPTNRISTSSRSVQDLYPLPNFGPPTLQSGNYRDQVPGYTGQTNFHHFTFRADHNLRTSDRLFGRVNARFIPRTNASTFPALGTWHQLYQGRNAVVSWTHLFGPTLLNEFRAGGSYIGQSYHLRTLGKDYLQRWGIQGIDVPQNIYGVPVFSITGLTSISGTEQRYAGGTNYQATNNVTWTLRDHFLKFGFDYIRDGYFGDIYNGNIFGQYNFSGVYTGLGFADFLLGIPQTTNVAAPNPPRDFRGNLLGFYAQDQFKVSRKLTLNAGVRYQLLGAYYPLSGTMYNFDPGTGTLVIPDGGLNRVNPQFPQNIPIVLASKVGYPARSLVRSNDFSIEPRIGFAYKVLSNTVVRAGYGIYANTIYGQLGQKMQGGPFGGAVTYTNSISGGVPLFSFPQPFLAVGTMGTQDVQGTNPRLRMPYSQQWNLTIERQLAGLGLRASYVGAANVNLIYTRNLNQPPASTIPFSNSRYYYPVYHAISYDDNGATDKYHGFEMAATKRAGRNVTFSSGWTWGKDLTDTLDTTTYGSGVIQDQFSRVSEKANGSLVLTHRIFAYGVYALPVGRRQRFLSKSHPVVEALFGSWEFAWQVVTQSGNFFTPSFSGFDPSNTNSIGGRPDVIPGVNLYPANQTVTGWFNPGAFAIPGCPASNPVCTTPANVGRFGNSGVNTLRAPPIRNLDLALMKSFNIRDRARLELRMLANDALNHPNFTIPRSNISSTATVATVNSTTAESSGARTFREVHLVVRLEF
jgi:hypothetical protein